jgi:hypothetical protein
MRADFASLATDTAFETMGTPGSYTPPGGPAIPCLVIPNQGDRKVPGFSGQPIAEGHTFDVRASEVTPVRDGVFTIDGEELTVLGDPVTNDPDRLVWTCTVG